MVLLNTPPNPQPPPHLPNTHFAFDVIFVSNHIQRNYQRKANTRTFIDKPVCARMRQMCWELSERNVHGEVGNSHNSVAEI